MTKFSNVLGLLCSGVFGYFATLDIALCATPSLADIARTSTVYIFFDVTNPNTGAKSTIQGTGFVVSKSGYVLTASHLFREWKAQRDIDRLQNEIRGSLRDKPGFVVEPPLILSVVNPGDPDAEDVALLRFPEVGRDYSAAAVCMSKDPKVGDSFFAYGFPQNSTFQPVPGTLGTSNGVGGRWTAASAFTYGMSGGPVYMIDGTVIGLVKGGLDDTDAVRWITPIQFATAMLATARYVEACAPPSIEWSLDNCKSESEAAQREFANDPSQIPRVEKLLQCRNPIGYELRGSEKFYRGDYQNAEKDFVLAVQNLPAQAVVKPMWQSDLADTYIETQKYSEAISLYQQILQGTPSDSVRVGLARAYLYKGKLDPSSYGKAVELLLGVDPTFRGMLEPGIVQVTLAAAQAGQIAQLTGAQKRSALAEAKKNLCTGIKKSDAYWRSILGGTKPFVHASFKEEIALIKLIGGSGVACPA